MNINDKNKNMIKYNGVIKSLKCSIHAIGIINMDLAVMLMKILSAHGKIN